MLTLTDVDDSLAAARADAGNRHFSPRGTVRCAGAPMFRNQLARDLACLLDLDPSVREWSCLPLALGSGDVVHVPDFMVVGVEGAYLIDAVETAEVSSSPWIEAEAARCDCKYERVAAQEIRTGARLANARDLLRYARWHCPLGDRVRLLGADIEVLQITLSGTTVGIPLSQRDKRLDIIESDLCARYRRLSHLYLVGRVRELLP